MEEITRYTINEIKALFFQYERACKSRQDAQLMKKLCSDLILILHLEPGKVYSSIPHEE